MTNLLAVNLKLLLFLPAKISYVMSCQKSHLIQLLRRCNDFVSATSLHGSIFKLGFLSGTITCNHLINCYARLGKTVFSRLLFDEMPQPNVVSWTSLMAGYVDMGKPKSALSLYSEMQESLVIANVFTFATVIKACSVLADLVAGKKIHCHLEILGFQRDIVVCSSLVDMYGKCNDVDQARRVFDMMDYRNVVSWTSMIAAYAQNARGNEALQVFREFNYLMSERPNGFMLASMVNACASLGRLVLGKVAHGAVIRGGYELHDVVVSSVIDMYAKCGNFTYSDKVFRRISSPTVIDYTSMIVGSAKFGLGDLSLNLFEEMIKKGIKPNDVTFLGVLYACSHSGLVGEGLQHLKSMYEKHGIMPDEKHYSCAVDMLCRVGRVDEAYKMAISMKVSPSQGALLWGSLLSASRLQGRLDIAVNVSKQLIESRQQVAGAYVTLSNTYALAGDWDKCHSFRAKMKRTGVHKEPGCSWVEIKDSTFVFYAGNLSCERGDEILSLLKKLEKKMKERGYVGGSTGLVFVDVEQEAKEEIVSLHSERLALAFALLSIPKGLTIRVMKNLRMCMDCHEAFKLISDIVERDFVVRDLNRFHHFKNGICTCKDFW